jgi:hypothetical protein
MTRHIFFAIALIGTGPLLIAPAAAVTALQCEDRAVNCGDRCTDVTGGAGDLRGHQNKCIQYCARQVSRCLSNAFIRSNASIRPQP